jgi:hypothetical protein
MSLAICRVDLQLANARMSFREWALSFSGERLSFHAASRISSFSKGLARPLRPTGSPRRKFAAAETTGWAVLIVVLHRAWLERARTDLAKVHAARLCVPMVQERSEGRHPFASLGRLSMARPHDRRGTTPSRHRDGFVGSIAARQWLGLGRQGSHFRRRLGWPISIDSSLWTGLSPMSPAHERLCRVPWLNSIRG